MHAQGRSGRAFDLRITNNSDWDQLIDELLCSTKNRLVRLRTQGVTSFPAVLGWATAAGPQLMSMELAGPPTRVITDDQGIPDPDEDAGISILEFVIDGRERLNDE